MSWGISDNASEKEKLKAEINDFFCGLNSVGDIDYEAYSQIYDAVMPIIDDMYVRRKEMTRLNDKNNLAEFKGQLVDTLEDFLEEKGVTPSMLPNKEREEDDDENAAIIYGWHYGMVADNIEHELCVHDLIGREVPCDNPQIIADTVNHVYEAYQEILDMIGPEFINIDDDDERRLKHEIRQTFMNWEVFA